MMPDGPDGRPESVPAEPAGPEPGRPGRTVPRPWWALAVVQLLVLVAGTLAVPPLLHPTAHSSASVHSPPTVAPTVARSMEPGDVVAGVSRVLAARDKALLARRRSAFLSATAPKSTAAAQAALLYADTAQVPLSGWDEKVDAASVTAVPGRPATYRLDIVRRYRLRGFDPGGVPQRRTLTVVHTSTDWRVLTDVAADGARLELWESGPVVVGHGASSLVLAHPADRAKIAPYAALADSAVREVTRVWGTGWEKRVVLIVPATGEELGGVLQSHADYSQIAALATADVVDSGGLRAALAERVVVNPATFSRLTPLGQRIVLTHEVTHVASRLDTGPSSPSWLVEGLADYVAYRDAGVATRVAARDLVTAARSGGLPAALPSDADFDPTAHDLTAAYELSWLACRLIVQRTGEAKLLAFYRAVGADHGAQDEVVRRQMAAVLSTTPQSFTTAWRQYVASAVS
ncbi:MAG: hypothetical protein QOI42_230 [Frankiaceae bacterium]|nr:hypothetical protein [Frankiaceae bacterium]